MVQNSAAGAAALSLSFKRGNCTIYRKNCRTLNYMWPVQPLWGHPQASVVVFFAPSQKGEQYLESEVAMQLQPSCAHFLVSDIGCPPRRREMACAELDAGRDRRVCRTFMNFAGALVRQVGSWLFAEMWVLTMIPMSENPEMGTPLPGSCFRAIDACCAW
jgi:hypothetical protein